MSAAIALENLTVAYERRPAVHHISGRFESGSLTAIVGPNGAGKSTLIKAIAGTMKPAQGRVDRGRLATRTIGYLPQAAEIDRSFPLSVADTVSMGAWHSIGPFRSLTRNHARLTGEALSTVGLEGFEGRSVGSLSSGQFQRVLFARLLLQDASVILLDEPFTAIDARTTRDLLELVRAWHGQGRTVIAVLHDIEQVRQHFPQTLLMAREAIAWGETSQVLSAANLRKARNMAEYWSPDALLCDSEDERS
ncbi:MULTISPECIES: zinc ABC transporter ATP-binding protein AztA [Pseudomonas syringae group]|uniref:Cation ABC transporter, ATP-binding protein n=1 Tax=Pseudomonas savastanoi TaxID=29438 RepID=A0A3M5GMF3_PSESS|nr:MULTISPECIES: zinc ABC transporter ATP-binding protein AztA [Pseudomonas syringae group]KWS87898.1 ABC transporter [Pseudomonas syringae pv. cerasicola]PHN69723.1 ABC transporter [Pseudomonas syringae pv. cerasicola]PHN71507.1 ABC transporter [Pseudomonas syringae pv. cerasicola]RMS68353.1 Cation ABC transporter, ATP-binding protein [Pseudomonas savastanoi]RMS87361.1 Cation ABC transporter, ATP-binding protein [Pseudomonas savastanoi]